MSETCKRCGRSFDTPVPPVTDPEGIHEIACAEWCGACNALVMTIIFRHGSAYDIFGRLTDPARRMDYAST